MSHGEGEGQHEDKAARAVAKIVFEYTKRPRSDGGEIGVRAEDYIATLASLTGEATLVASGLVEIETAGHDPGSWIFGDQINEILTGSPADPDAEDSSVIGTLVHDLVPAFALVDAFRPMSRWYKHAAATAGSAPWGRIAIDAPDENQPWILPIQVNFELRDIVTAALQELNVSGDRRAFVCAKALAIGMTDIGHLGTPDEWITLAMEIVFGMAKMMPMSKRQFKMVEDGSQSSERRSSRRFLGRRT
jgi:hypothetical protein